MKILIVEDDPVSRRILESFLNKWDYIFISSPDGREAWERIQEEGEISLVISDWMMPGMDGLELCRMIRSMDRPGYIYFIILTAKGSKEDLIQGLEAGADDYLIKPFDQQELRCRVKIGERIINLEQRVLYLANTDGLTGILNRRAFLGRLEQEIQRSIRGKTHLSFIMMDIDHFKQINDRYGHQAGDLVLKRFSGQLNGILRPYDGLGRYGGEEFAAFIPGVDQSSACGIAERMRGQVESIAVPLPGGPETIHVTASFGVSSLRIEATEKIDTLIRRADQALYRAKAEGRNRVCDSEDL